jgi:hypothetical protein
MDLWVWRGEWDLLYYPELLQQTDKWNFPPFPASPESTCRDATEVCTEAR